MWTKSLPSCFSQRGDAAHQLAVVAHVLEHLDRDHPVEAALARREDIHVGGGDRDVPEAPAGRFGQDVLPLGGRVRDPEDARARVARRP